MRRTDELVVAEDLERVVHERHALKRAEGCASGRVMAQQATQ